MHKSTITHLGGGYIRTLFTADAEYVRDYWDATDKTLYGFEPLPIDPPDDRPDYLDEQQEWANYDHDNECYGED